MDHVTHNTHITDEDLSLYLDGALDDREIEDRVTRHLDQCIHCRERLDDLRTITALLAELPAPALPRSFRLSERDVPRPAAPMLIQPWFMRFQPAIRSAAAIAAVLLLTVVGASLLLDSPATSTDDAVSMMEAAPEERVAEEDAVADSDEDAVADSDEDADAGVAAEPDAESDSPESFGQVTPPDEPARGVSALRVIGISLAAITVALVVAGFVLPRWWVRSQQGRT